MADIIEQISDGRGDEDLIYSAFRVCGFNKDYIFKNKDEFRVHEDPISGYKKYGHNDDHLFTCALDINTQKMMIEFTQTGLDLAYETLFNKKENDNKEKKSSLTIFSDLLHNEGVFSVTAKEGDKYDSKLQSI